MIAALPLITDALIVDDLPATRAWLARAVLIAFPDARLCEAADLKSGHRLSADRAPDLALIDLRLPDGHGAQLIEALRRLRPETCIVVPTIFDDDAYLFEALRAGASGYVLKDQTAERIACSLKAIQIGEPPLSVPLARRLLRLAATGALRLAADEQQLLQARARGTPITQLSGTSGRVIEAIYRRLSGNEPPRMD